MLFILGCDLHIPVFFFKFPALKVSLSVLGRTPESRRGTNVNKHQSTPININKQRAFLKNKRINMFIFNLASCLASV